MEEKRDSSKANKSLVQQDDVYKSQDFSSNDLNQFSSSSRWLNNSGEEVTEVFGFNANAELVNGRAAMFGFIMLLITELAFGGDPVTLRIFGIS